MPSLLQLRAAHLNARSLQASVRFSKHLQSPRIRAIQQYRVLLTSSRTVKPQLALLLPPSSPRHLPPHPATAIMGTTQTQNRSHGSHGHHHHKHGGENVYLTSKNTKDAGVRITRIGLFVNLGMALGKGIGGYAFNSQALIADAFHALTDLVSDFMTLGTVSWSLKPPTSRFPTGYGKIESLGALGVSGLLLCGGALMGLNASEILYTQFLVDAAEAAGHTHGLGIFGHSHSHGAGGHMGPNINAAWLAAGSIVVKEWLYRATIKIARERKSSVLASNAIHHRVDSLTSIVALLTIGGSHILPDASWLDPVGGLLISLMVIRAGIGNTYSALLELADIGVDSDTVASVKRSVTKAIVPIPGVDTRKGVEGYQDIEIREIQGIKSGPNYLMEVELAVPGNWSVERIRAIEHVVRERVGAKVRGVKRVKVRFVAREKEEKDFLDEFIGEEASPRSSPEVESEGDANGHDEHEHEHGHSHNEHSHNEHGHTHEHERGAETTGDVNKRR